jgi:hypothetical protein
VTNLLQTVTSARPVVHVGQAQRHLRGAIGLYTYTVVSRDSDGNREETNYPFTVLYTEMPRWSPT